MSSITKLNMVGAVINYDYSAFAVLQKILQN